MELPAIEFCDVTLDKYRIDLIRAGYEEIGEGAYATVYAHPDEDFVVKVGQVDFFKRMMTKPACLSDYDKDKILEEWRADGYLNFLHSIEKNNPYFPKIHGVKFFANIRAGHHYYVIKMERLYPLGSLDKHLLSKTFTVNTGTVGFKDFCKSLFRGELNKNKHLTTANKVLLALFKTCSSDVHTGNIMIRKGLRGNHVVITDPAA